MASQGDFSETHLGESWDRAAQSIKPYYQAPSTRVYLEQEKNLINTHFAPVGGKKLLKTDLWNEAKNTQILKYILEKGAEAYAVDISLHVTQQALISFNQSKNRPEIMIADIRRLPYKKNTFDCIYSMGTVEHFPDCEKAIQELYRVLKHGGKAIIGVPNKHDLFLRPLLVSLLQKLRLYSFGYEKSYTKKELRQMLERAHFTVEGSGSLLFMPGILRILDIFLFQHMRPMTKLSKILMAPFVFLYDRFRFFRQKGYLTVCIARK
jgi:SAM-dependent methyltransferase